jgi:phage terminase large subunit
VRVLRPATPTIDVHLPPKFFNLFQKARFKSHYGGRGSAKSRSYSRALVAKAHTSKELILCTREYQNSIKDSVHRLLKNEITRLDLQQWFDVTDRTIKSRITGSEFVYAGLKINADEIKSMEGVTITWLEEAQNTSDESLKMLFPTVRENNSEIWASWNPDDEDSPVARKCITKPPKNSIITKVSWRDNPWFPAVLEEERLQMLEDDPIAYEWIWEGGFRKIGNAVIFNKRVEYKEFDTPTDARLFHGADWGFSTDPSVLMRCFIQDSCLFIDYEAFGYGVELDELPGLFDIIPTARKWPIKADCARPETISHMRRKGFNISGAEKWSGSVEDGIAFLKAFKKIIIHPRCPNISKEARLYSYKVDKKQLDKDGQPVVLPIIVDANNHGWDSIRYALDGYIRSTGAPQIRSL